MKIACIGNMNNNLFTLVRYLRDAGLDAYLLVLNSVHPHFLPHADSYDLSYREYTHMLTWGDLPSFASGAPQCPRDLEGFDFLIGCEYAPAFLHRAGLRLDIFIPCGDDIHSAPFYQLKVSRFPLVNYQLARHQREGIRQSGCLVLGQNNLHRDVLKRLDYKGQVFPVGLPMVYESMYQPESLQDNAPRTHWHKEMSAIRAAHEVVVLHHARQVWRNYPHPLHDKANDVLIRGFAEYLDSARAATAALVLIEYGQDVPTSKMLIQELGIEKHVFWLPLMFRKDVMPCLALADIGCGEFRTSCVLGGAISEVLAMGKPLLTYRDDALHKDLCAGLYPIMNARTPQQVAALLEDYVARPEHYRAMGNQGRLWHHEYQVRSPLAAITTRITQAST